MNYFGSVDFSCSFITLLFLSAKTTTYFFVFF